jgi:hypothetical protein
MPELFQIEGIPYLTTITQEGLRLHPSVAFDRIEWLPKKTSFMRMQEWEEIYCSKRGMSESKIMMIADSKRPQLA